MSPLPPQHLRARQFRALLNLQQRLMLRFWQGQGQMYRWSTGLSHGFSLLLSLALTFGVGFVIAIPGIDSLQHNLPPQLVFWLWGFALSVLGFMWTLSPLLFLMKNENLSLDLRKLIPYPISTGVLHRFHSLLAFFEPWSLFFYPICLGILWSSAYWPDTHLIIRLGIIPLILLWSGVHTLGNRLLQDLMLSLFRSRYWKELLSLILLFIVIFVSFIPAFFAEQMALYTPPKQLAGSPETLLYSLPFWLNLETVFNGILYFTPPGVFAQGLWALYQHDLKLWVWQVLSLSLWFILIYFESWHLMQRLLHEAETPHPRPQVQKRALRIKIPLPDVVYAIALKDLRTYFRSLLGKLAFFLTPLMVLLLRGAGLGSHHQQQPYHYLLSMISYLFLTSMYLYINHFGHEGEGFKHYILSGVSPQHIFWGKNLALGLFGSAQFSLITGLFILLYPNLDTAILGFGWFSFFTMLLGVLSLGNLLSIRTPGPMNLNQSHYRQSNGTPILLGFQVLMVLSGLMALPLLIYAWKGTPLIILGMAVCSLMGVGWFYITQYAAQIFGSEAPYILSQITAKDAS